MRILYDAIYLLLFIGLMPWIAWRYFGQRKNQRGWGQKLFGWVPIRDNDKPCVWIHAVSVGEVNLLRPLIDEIENRYPGFDIAISTTTETGFDLAKKKYDGHLVFFCPSDFSWSVATAIKRIQPSLMLLTELELWPNLISTANSNRIPVALINGRISQQSFRGYKRLQFVFSRLLKKLRIAIVQTNDYAKRLNDLGMSRERIKVSGNMKFDGLIKSTDNTEIRTWMANFGISSGSFVFVAGSTQEPEDLMAISIYQKLKPRFPELRMILVPRHPDRANRLDAVLEDRGIPVVFRSETKNAVVETEPIIVVDVIGELNQWWSVANFGYVGGSMGSRGGQNMIEPAAHGIPVCFGPRTDNFKDVVSLMLSAEAAKVVNDADELEALLKQAMTRPVELSEMAKRGQDLVHSQRGSTARTLDMLSDLFDPVRQKNVTNNRAA